MVLVLPLYGWAGLPPLEPAVEMGAAEIPTAWSLQQISPECRHVAQLRSGGNGGCLRQQGIVLLNRNMGLNRGQGGQCPQHRPVRCQVDIARQTMESLNIDKALWRGDAGLHQGQQIGSPGQDTRATHVVL